VFPRKNAPDAPTPRGTVFPGPSLYWFSQTVGPGRGLETAIEALSRSRLRPHLYLRGTSAAGYQRVLQDLASAHGVADQLHFLEPVAPDKLERAAACYDIGFVGERPDTKNRAIALTNKFFSYWTSGLPTLVSDIPSHMPFVRKHPEFIRSFADPASLAALLDDWLGDPSQLANARHAAFQAAQEIYSWEKEAVALLSKVSDQCRRDK
jgi:glycosyltransferase involved in cell wall biosynthesis